MPDSSPDHATPEDSQIAARCLFVRGRNALVVRADFAPVFVDYYLHLMQHGLKPEPGHDQIFKDALAAFTLYLASRPWKEVTAWTTNLQEPRLNLFVTGNSLAGTVTGRIFTDNVRTQDTNQLFSEVRVEGQETRRSIVEFNGHHFFEIAEHFHQQSDQRPARFFHHNGDEFVLVAAQPECDLDWLESLNPDAVRALETDEELSLLETRRYRFHCGCDPERILPALTPLSEPDLDDLFAGRQTIPLTCPRCAALYQLTREQLDAIRENRDNP